MADPVILAIFDNAMKALEAMGRESGYHRDYRGVVGMPIAPQLEPDLENPWVQCIIGEVVRQLATGNEIMYDSHRHRQAFFVRVSVPPVMRILSGRQIRDLTMPIWEVRADIHKALFVDRTRGSSGYCTTYYIGPEAPEYFGIDVGEAVEVGGVTVIEKYAIEWSHSTGDMGTAAP